MKSAECRLTSAGRSLRAYGGYYGGCGGGSYYYGGCGGGGY
jgi:hypothetical protein